jgi:hypothetical protein
MIMSTKPDSLVALDVTGDDYATTAAHDQHSGADATVAAVEAEDTEDEREKAGAARAARMRYTDQDFEAQKASYTARIDQGGVSTCKFHPCDAIPWLIMADGGHCIVIDLETITRF